VIVEVPSDDGTVVEVPSDERMLAAILPSEAIAVETRGDPADVTLFPEEELALGQAVQKRRREFVTARACARGALARLGLPPLAIPTGARGEPLWPTGVVGSITHCEGYRACALARASDIITIGIDAEPNLALPDGVLAAIALEEERARVGELARTAPTVRWDRLLFSAKEAVYKAWFPLTGSSLGFEDATLLFDPSRFGFTASLLVPGPVLAGGELRMFSGRWLVRDGLVLTAIALPAAKISDR
jgi:4'-phosphopantetheinyl transferase EntD